MNMNVRKLLESAPAVFTRLVIFGACADLTGELDMNVAHVDRCQDHSRNPLCQPDQEAMPPSKRVVNGEPECRIAN